MSSQPTFFRRTLHGLAHADEVASAALAKIKHGAQVEVKITRPRNIRFHRKFWALLNLVFENQSHYVNIDHMLAAMKTAVGHCDLVAGKDGKLIAIPKSISFHRMDDLEFSEFYDRCIEIVAKHFLPGVDRDELRREVEEFMK